MLYGITELTGKELADIIEETNIGTDFTMCTIFSKCTFSEHNELLPEVKRLFFYWNTVLSSIN